MTVIILNLIALVEGIPTKDLYEKVKPWYLLKIVGTTYSRYVQCGTNSFWAIAYYNGSDFTFNSGAKVNYSEITDIELEFKKMFESMKLECTMQ